MEHIGDLADRAVRGGNRGGRSTVPARKDAQKQEKVIDLKIIKDRLGELKSLNSKSKDASAAFGDAIKKAAQDSGLNASAVRKFVMAHAGDSLAERKRDAEQLSLLFDEVKV